MWAGEYFSQPMETKQVMLSQWEILFDDVAKPY